MKARKQIMIEAHKIARTLEGDYIARLSEGLRKAWENLNNSDMKSEKLNAEDLFDSSRFIIVKIYVSFVYGVSIKAAKRGQVRPSSINDKYYQALNPDKFVELSRLNEKEINDLCLKHKGLHLEEMPQLI